MGSSAKTGHALYYKGVLGVFKMPFGHFVIIIPQIKVPGYNYSPKLLTSENFSLNRDIDMR